jgi:hypothetical protein
MTPTAYPLHWPVGWKRTLPGQREYGRFGRRETKPGRTYPSTEEITIAQACSRLLEELKRMGVPDYDVIVSTNVELRLDGLPRSDRAQPADPGVAVYWKDGKNQRCMAIDRYTKVAQNLAALAATIEAMRAIERHGGAVILDRAFAGFQALPAPIVAGMRKPWREVLGFPADYAVTPALVQERHRSRASQAHPDKGGTSEEMAALNAARAEALEELGHG